MDELATKYLKNYQVWHHRRLLLTALKTQLEARPGSDPEDVRSAAREELDFIAKGLQADTKNYHTWAYRQWILAYFGDEEVWKEELPWVEELLGDDVRNNSAWHHRFFVVWQSGVRRGDEDREATKLREIRSVFSNTSMIAKKKKVRSFNAFLYGVGMRSRRLASRPITHPRGTISGAYSISRVRRTRPYKPLSFPTRRSAIRSPLRPTRKLIWKTRGLGKALNFRAP